jgi:chemotaxis protein histidine kinase CheA/ActR/RegA family two-component response regulator
VNLFYDKVLANDLLKDFFADVDMDVLRAKQAAFMIKVLGGPDNYDGKDMATAHASLSDKGVSDEHFDAAIFCLQEALVELGVWGPTVEDVISVVESTREDVLGRSEAAIAAKSVSAVPAPVVETKPEVKAEDPAKKEGGAKESLASASIRVSVDVLENLMTMVSELVLTRNQLMQILREQEESDFAAPLQRLGLITSELQEGVMKTRMQPIGNAWAKLPRIIRDLCQELGKKMDLEMLGAETELDRQVLELIRDPLTHMIRNSADHGIEMPDVRVAAGKPETGKVILNAYHQGGHIIIQIKDDGAGLAVEKIKAKVIEKGLATEAELAEMPDPQIQAYIMRAGFSTAAAVTSVSGRGVGMDVVKTNIDNIGGTVELVSTEGQGTTFTIKIPLTLAIVSALIVECAKERFAIPQLSVLELVRSSAHSELAIEMINDTPVLRLRNKLLPLVSLREVLGLTVDEEEAETAPQAVTSQEEESLFERIGGAGAIDATVKLFYEKVLADDSLSEFFADVDMDVLGKKQGAFFTMALGGPNNYDGKDMRTSHASLVKRGLNEAHFDAVAGHLVSTLTELGVPAGLIDEVVAIVGSTKDDILGRDKPTQAEESKGQEVATKKDGALTQSGVGEQFIVVSQVGTYTFGIIVDKVFDTEEIVVKPVSPILRDITLFSGNTILGDGSVIMILDPNGIAAATGEQSAGEGHTDAATAADTLEGGSERASLLIFRAGDKSPKAVPLALIARLEEVQLDQVEITHGRPMVQYRGHLMPLIPIDEDYQMKTEGRQQVLVFSDRDHTMGLVVDEIIDIVEESANIELAAERPGILGSAIISEKATDMIDAGYYLTKAFPDWFGGTDIDAKGNGEGRRILLVDDSPFFRNLLTPMLSVAGYDVTTAEDGQAALEMCDHGLDIDLIVSDIEMPGMNGFEFAQAVRSGSKWKDIPIVALSSRTSQKDIDRGREVGFSDYVSKTDRDGLLQTLAETLGVTGDA